MYVHAVNSALKGIPEERVRFHTYYGINEGPRIYEAALADVIDDMFKIAAGFFSFEAANPRHEHEYHLFETGKVPDGKVICPGVITHASNIVEHPELIAERILRYALVGRENVIAGGGLRVLIAGALQDRSASHDCLGKIQGSAAGSGHCHEKALDMNQNHQRTFPPVPPRYQCPRWSIVFFHLIS